MTTLNLGKISTIIAQELGGEFDSTLWFNQPGGANSNAMLSNYIGDIYYASSQMSSAIQLDANVDYAGLSQEQIDDLDFNVGDFTGMTVGFSLPEYHVVTGQKTSLRFYDFSTNENIAQCVIDLFKQTYAFDGSRTAKEFTINGEYPKTGDFFIGASR